MKNEGSESKRLTPEQLLRQIRAWLIMPSNDGVERTAWPELVAQIDATLPASDTADNEGEHLDCPMCGAQKSFTINPQDEAVGYCSVERQSWRIQANKEHSQ